MTVVIGQHFFEGIVMIADSRSSLAKKGKVTPWRDNTQKIFFLTPTLVIGFAGDIEFAGSIISFLAKQIQMKPRFGLLNIFARKAPKVIKFAYNQLCEKTDRRPDIGFIIAGIDFTRPNEIKDEKGKLVGHVRIFDKKILKISSPSFNPEYVTIQKPFVAIGSGARGTAGLEDEFRKIMFGQVDSDLNMKAFMVEIILRGGIKSQGGEPTVGGLYQIAIIDDLGPRFLQYQSRRDDDSSAEIDVEMIVRNNRFIQRDLKTGNEMPLLYPPEVIQVKDSDSELFANLEEE